MTLLDLLKFVAPVASLSDSRLTVPLVDAVNEISWLLTKRLWKQESDLIISATDGTVIPFLTFAEGINTVALPAGFLGFSEKPYLVANGKILTPFSREKHSCFEGETGVPEFYEIVGKNISVYPTPTVSTDLKARFYASPAAATDMAGEVPFSPLFDDIYRDGVVLMNSGMEKYKIAAILKKSLKASVDDVLDIRATPQSHFVESAY